MRSTVCATDDVAAAVEELQSVLGVGPCVDVLHGRGLVLVPDLDDPSGGHDGRWPAFREGAREHGVRAVFAFPLRLGASLVGALDLYRARPGPLEVAQLSAALVLADEVTAALLDLRTGPDAGDDAAGRTAYRLLVHAASGMVSVQLGVAVDVALVRLRARAFAGGQSLDDLAAAVLSGTVRFEESP